MTRTLGRKKAHRVSLMRNLATSLFLYESIITTEAKAKELRSIVDRIISKAKPADLSATRYVEKNLFDKKAVKKVVKEIVPRYSKRSSGFTRIIKLDDRLGDKAPRVIIELVDKKVYIKNDDTDKTSIKKVVKPSDKNTVKTTISVPKKK